jgi:2'-5' RNA ligase
VNATLAAGRGEALRFDATHLPHLTLAQQFVERARLADLFAALDRILRHEPGVPLRIAGAVADGLTVQLAVEISPDLQRLHELVMDTIEPFESPEGGADAFRAHGETIRPKDVDWVRSYRENAAYVHYRPHVTLGHAEVTPPFEAVDFHADHLAVCQLGRFCSCRLTLKDWRLS